jgi:hypothetical protein
MARKQKYTDEVIIAALEKCKGMIYHAAKKVGCNPDTIHERVKTSEAVRACVQAHRGRFVDAAEMKLSRAVDRGEAWAVALVLKTLGRDRGYVEKAEQETTIKGDVSHTHAISDPAAALAPYAAVLERFLAGQRPPEAAPEVPGQPVGGAEAAPETGPVPPPR